MEVLVETLLEKDVLEEVEVRESREFTSRFFVVPKKTPGQWRAILNLSTLNTYIRKESFKMETA